MVREVDEDRAQEINYAKNKLRGHINPFKEAELFFHTWEKVKRLEDIGKKFGVSISYVSETVSLRKIPDEVQKIIPRGINRSLLEILARLEDPSEQVQPQRDERRGRCGSRGKHDQGGPTWDQSS